MPGGPMTHKQITAAVAYAELFLGPKRPKKGHG